MINRKIKKIYCWHTGINTLWLGNVIHSLLKKAGDGMGMGTVIVVIGRLEVGDIVVDARSRGSHWGPVVIDTGSFVVGPQLNCWLRWRP